MSTSVSDKILRKLADGSYIDVPTVRVEIGEEFFLVSQSG